MFTEKELMYLEEIILEKIENLKEHLPYEGAKNDIAVFETILEKLSL